MCHLYEVDGNGNDIDGVDGTALPACYQVLKGDKRIVRFDAKQVEDIVGHVEKAVSCIALAPGVLMCAGQRVWWFQGAKVAVCEEPGRFVI